MAKSRFHNIELKADKDLFLLTHRPCDAEFPVSEKKDPT